MTPIPNPDHTATRTHEGTASFPSAEAVAVSDAPVVPLPSTPPPATTPIIGPPGFEIDRRLDEGGMGTVYLARETALGRLVALKVMKLNVFDAASARERFAREVRAMARIEHPNLVPIYHSGEFRGVPYFTMRYLAGGTLAGVRPRPLSVERGADLLRQAARGVAALHAAGILHRDLKPANVLLDDAGVPHVADFGLVKWLEEDEQSVTGPRHGTPPYMSPEQTLGHSRRLVPACDVWGLGVIGYELLTGHRPFVATHREELYDLIRETEPANPSLLRADLPEPLADILQRCLRKSPAERYAHAGALADDLDRFLAGQPLAAVPTISLAEPPVSPPSPAPTRRRALLAAVGGLGAMAGTAAGVLWFQRRTPAPDPVLPPDPKAAFVERVQAALREKQTITLIGETGLPDWHRLDPTDVADLTAEAGKPAVLAVRPAGGLPFVFLELFADRLPVPVRLEAELRWDGQPESMSRMGLYLGGRVWPGEPGNWRTALGVVQMPAIPRTPGHPAMPEKYTSGALVLPPPDVPAPTEPVTGSAQARPAKAPPPAPGEWVPFALSLPTGDKGGAGGTVFGESVIPNGPFTVARYRQQLGQRKLPQPLPTGPDFQVPPDTFGPGLGIYVRASRVAIRNVRLVPI